MFIQSKSQIQSFIQKPLIITIHKKSHVRQKIHCIYTQTESKAYKYMQRFMLGKNLHTSVSKKLK